MTGAVLSEREPDLVDRALASRCRAQLLGDFVCDRLAALGGLDDRLEADPRRVVQLRIRAATAPPGPFGEKHGQYLYLVPVYVKYRVRVSRHVDVLQCKTSELAR